MSRYDSDLMCAPWYFGPGDVHMSNHAGQMVQLVDGGFELVRDCFESPGTFIDDIRDFEEDNGLGESADENFSSGG